jgi:glycosyltransferase involved in cell wall biosynthesis
VTGSASDQRKRVLFVTPWYPLPDSPAAGVFVREHARAAALFDDVAVVHLVGRTSKQRRLVELEQVENEPFPVIRASYRTTKHVGWLVELAAFLKALSSLRGSGFVPDVIHGHIAWGAVPAELWSRITGLPMVLTEQWTAYLDADPHSLRGIAALRTNRVLKHAARILPVGSALEHAMRRWAPEASYDVIPNVVDCDLFRPPVSRPRANPIRLAAVGLLSPQKDYPTMLQAMRQLVDAEFPVQLKIIGYGDYETQLAELIADAGLDEHVELVGYLPKTDIAERLRESHVFVHSSRFETFCAAAAEALASGLPVVSTRCGGPEDYVTPETGRIVEVGDADALASAIRTVIEQLDTFDPDRIAAHARGRFAADVVGRRLHGVYMSVASRRGQRADPIRPARPGRRQRPFAASSRRL